MKKREKEEITDGDGMIMEKRGREGEKREDTDGRKRDFQGGNLMVEGERDTGVEGDVNWEE